MGTAVINDKLALQYILGSSNSWNIIRS